MRFGQGRRVAGQALGFPALRSRLNFMDESSAPAYLLLPGGGKFLLTGNTSIGRSGQNSITLEGPKVSRVHTHIYRIAGHHQVVDSQSRNGTYVNRQRLIGQVTL